MDNTSLTTNQFNQTLLAMNECAKTPFGRIILPVFNGLICVLSLTTNSALLLHYILKKRFSSASRLFTVNLAVLDLLLALSLPLTVAYRSQGSDWHFGQVLCILSLGLFYGNLYGSSFFMLCICVDRYMAVCHPLRYQNVNGHSLCQGLSLAIWSVIAAFFLWGCLSLNPLNPQPDSTQTCGEAFSDKQWHSQLVALVIMGSILFFFLPYMSIIVCYTLMVWRLMALDGSDQKKKLRQKSLRAIFSVVAIMSISYLPFHIMQVVNAHHRLNVAPGHGASYVMCVGHGVLTCVASLNSVLDPFVYYFLTFFSWTHSCHKGKKVDSTEHML